MDESKIVGEEFAVVNRLFLQCIFLTIGWLYYLLRVDIADWIFQTYFYPKK